MNEELTTGHPKWLTLIPVSEIESGAINQVYNLLQFDFVKKIVTMPDIHEGYTMPIGGIGLFEGHISPSCVGYDIGCGMCYIDTKIKVEDMFPDRRAKVEAFNKIGQTVPSGLGNTRKKRIEQPIFKSAIGDKKFSESVDDKAQTQCGSLGSGKNDCLQP